VIRWFVILIVWFGFVFLSCLIVENSWGLVVAAEEVPFLQERIHLAGEPFWRATLGLHAAAGIVCLVASFLQFFRSLIRRFPALHRWLGRAYSGSCLWVLCPTGFYLSFFAKGGALGVAGFITLGIATFYTTWKGWRAIRLGEVEEHVVWMIRSFAMITTAISFRVYNIALTYAGMDYELVYLVALYLSLFGNAFAAELLVLQINRSKPSKQTTLENTEQHENKTDTRPHPDLAWR
jgi:hypothetical protein